MKLFSKFFDSFDISAFFSGLMIMVALFLIVNQGGIQGAAWDIELKIDDKLKWESMEVCTITDENEPTLEEETHNANAAAAPLVEKKADKSLHFDDSYSLGPSPIKACFPSHQVRINAYMYHYVRESHRDSSGSVVYGNSITPETARAHYEHLSSLQSQNKIHLAFGSEIEEWEKADCFPHSNIVMLTFDDGRWDNYHYLLPLAREFNIKANLGIIANRIAFSVNERIDSFMTFEEIRRMIDSGYFEIQSHSGTHTDLRQKSYEAQRLDICESTKYLEKLFDIKINNFVYPMGLYNQTSMNVARDCGLSYAFTTLEGNNSVSDLSVYPFELSRWRVNRWSTAGDLYGR